MPVLAPATPAQRLTLTLPALNLSREIFFLVAGAEKAPALAHALSRDHLARGLPGRGGAPGRGQDHLVGRCRRGRTSPGDAGAR